MSNGNDIALSAVAQFKNAVITPQAGLLIGALPSHLADRGNEWIQGVLGVIKSDDSLRNAAMSNAQGFINAVQEAARLGLMPGTDEFYLVAFGNKIKPIVGRSGHLELIYRSGRVSDVIVYVVRENDSFEFVMGLDSQPKFSRCLGDRGEIVLAVAYAVYRDGGVSKVALVDKERIETAMEFSGGRRGPSSVWSKHEVKMWEKTAVHELAHSFDTSIEECRPERLVAISERRVAEREMFDAQTRRLEAENRSKELELELLRAKSCVEGDNGVSLG